MKKHDSKCYTLLIVTNWVVDTYSVEKVNGNAKVIF
jgi:hypothetical protein